ncbi:hypothetical protein FOA52_013416 [Chlamydomonas sp. UWO 241]|nr:hypothetical protein FOA52_013416 [Chlamydomonas sp. UWO 241]
MCPGRFFVSWSGVLTLAYTGFSPALEGLKARMQDGETVLPRENPGSKWPKTSLGCLRDGARLTPQQLSVLSDICRELSEAALGESMQETVFVDRLSIVLYGCRCLEHNRRLSMRTVAMAPAASPAECAARPSEEERGRVAGVMSEMSSPDYWFHASKDGSRESHYRGPALGLTLVHDISCFWDAQGGPGEGLGSAFWDAVRAFRARVDAELPGMYTWFDESSLHITVRALMG